MIPDNDTIIGDSPLGKRLSRIHKREAFEIHYQGKTIPLAARIGIGRDPANLIALDDSMVSRHHALIQKIRDELFVTDLGSRNGTTVNGKPVEPHTWARLNPGDELRVGRTALSIS